MDDSIKHDSPPPVAASQPTANPSADAIDSDRATKAEHSTPRADEKAHVASDVVKSDCSLPLMDSAVNVWAVDGDVLPSPVVARSEPIRAESILTGIDEFYADEPNRLAAAGSPWGAFDAFRQEADQAEVSRRRLVVRVATLKLLSKLDNAIRGVIDAAAASRRTFVKLKFEFSQTSEFPVI